MTPRGLFQLHFSTAIVLMFSAAATIWLNTARMSFGTAGWPVQSTDGYILNILLCSLLLLAIAITLEMRIQHPKSVRKRTIALELFVGWVVIYGGWHHYATHFYTTRLTLDILSLITEMLSVVAVLFLCHFISEVLFVRAGRSMSGDSN